MDLLADNLSSSPFFFYIYFSFRSLVHSFFCTLLLSLISSMVVFLFAVRLRYTNCMPNTYIYNFLFLDRSKGTVTFSCVCSMFDDRMRSYIGYIICCFRHVCPVPFPIRFHKRYPHLPFIVYVLLYFIYLFMN